MLKEKHEILFIYFQEIHFILTVQMNQETVLNVADYFIELTKNRSESVIVFVVYSKFNLDSRCWLLLCFTLLKICFFYGAAYSKDHGRYDRKNGFSKHEFLVIKYM